MKTEKEEDVEEEVYDYKEDDYKKEKPSEKNK